MFEDGWDSPTVTPQAAEWLGSWWPAELPTPWDHEAWAAMSVANSFGSGRRSTPRVAARAADVESIAREVARWEPQSMTPDRLLVMVQVTQRLIDWAQAQRLAAVGELHRRRGADRYPQAETGGVRRPC
jgi:hypothetical protein